MKGIDHFAEIKNMVIPTNGFHCTFDIMRLLLWPYLFDYSKSDRFVSYSLYFLLRMDHDHEEINLLLHAFAFQL